MLEQLLVQHVGAHAPLHRGTGLVGKLVSQTGPGVIAHHTKIRRSSWPYGPWQACHDRCVRWRRDGTWDRLLAFAQTRSDAVGEPGWTVGVDAGVVRAHHRAAVVIVSLVLWLA